MSDTIKMGCGLCEDLAPLVADGVAGEESRAAVRAHIAVCPECRERFSALSGGTTGEAAQEAIERDDARIVRRVRERASGWALTGILASLMLGVLAATTSADGPWLMLLIFPAICGGVYLTGARLWKWVPLAAAVFWIAVTLLMSGAGLSDIPTALRTSLLPLGLSYIGALVAALLKYAARGGNQMKRFMRILAGILGSVLLLGLLAAYVGANGDPLSQRQAEYRAIAYAEEIYPGQTFGVQYAARSGPFSYRVTVQSQESEDTRFSVETNFWLHTTDVDSGGTADHERMVESGWNTCYRLGEEAAKRAAAILWVELPELKLSPIYGADRDTVFVELCCSEEALSATERMEGYERLLVLDQAFEPEMLKEVPACLSAVALWDGEPTEEDLRDVMARIRSAMEKHGMAFDYYDITLLQPEAGDKGLSSGVIRAEEIAG